MPKVSLNAHDANQSDAPTGLTLTIRTDPTGPPRVFLVHGAHEIAILATPQIAAWARAILTTFLPRQELQPPSRSKTDATDQTLP